MNQTRREFLITGGTVGAVAMAGCMNNTNPHSLSENPHEDRVKQLPQPFQGNGDSDVVVRVFADFTCPHCHEFENRIYPDLYDEYITSGKVRYEFFDFPLPVRPTAYKAHNAARSVQNVMGMDKYWEYHDLLFENQKSLSDEKLGSLANQIGGAGPDVIADARDLIYHPVIKANKQTGEENGVTGTPHVFVGWDKVEDLSYTSLSDKIESEL